MNFCISSDFSVINLGIQSSRHRRPGGISAKLIAGSDGAVDHG